MPTTDDPDKFRKRWNQHIGKLSKLSQTLPPEKYHELNAAMDELHDLVDIAAEELEENDE